jgi:hypothetical protein
MRLAISINKTERTRQNYAARVLPTCFGSAWRSDAMIPVYLGMKDKDEGLCIIHVVSTSYN